MSQPWFKRLRAFSALSGLRLVDVAIGLIKDVLLTRVFGLGLYLDAYFVGTSFLDIGSGYFQQMGYGILLPFYNRQDADGLSLEEIHQRQQTLTLVFMNYMTLSTLLVAVGMVILHQWIVDIALPTRSHDNAFLDGLFMASLPISILCQGSFALRTLLLQQKRFHLFYLPGILSTVVFIAIFWGFSGSLGAKALLWALPVSQVVQLALYWHYLGIRWQWLWKARDLGPMFKLALPNALICVVYYLFTPVDNYFLSQLPAGELSAFRYAAKMVTVLSTLTIFSLQMTLIPALMQAGSQEDTRTMRRLILQGLKESILLSLPVFIGLFFLATPLVQLVFERGAFTADDTARVVQSMLIQMLGLPYIGAWMLISRCFNSLFWVKEFLVLGVVFLGLRVGLDYWGLQAGGMAGVAWMTTVHAYVMLAVGLVSLWVLVRRKKRAA